MITHIVCWKLKDNAGNASKMENAEKIRIMLEELPSKISSIRKLEVGINAPDASMQNWDVVLYTVFDNMTILDEYQRHPEHVKVAEFVRSVVESRCCVDYRS